MNQPINNILIIEKMHHDALMRLKGQSYLNIRHLPNPISYEDIKKRLPQYHAIVIRSKTRLDNTLLSLASNLQLIIRLGAGLDNIDLDAASRQKIEVFRPPIGNTISAAEHTFGLILSLTRHIHTAHTSVKQGMWTPKLFFSHELYEKTIGIIGLGRIGTRVALMAKAFGMRIIGCDPYIDKNNIHPELKNNIQWTHLNSLCKQCEYISLHVPLKKDTYHLISHEQFRYMNQDSYLINTSRGDVIDELSLIEALNHKKIKALAMDTFKTEPLPLGHPFMQMNNVLLTPHIGGSTKEAERRIAMESAEKIIDFFQN